jgi:hypothetical protein
MGTDYLDGGLNILHIVTMVPTGYLFSYSYSFPNEFPVWCLYQKDMVWGYDEQPNGIFRFYGHQYNLLYILLALSILWFGYVTRVWALMRGDNTIIYGLFRLPTDQPWTYFESSIDLRLSQLEIAKCRSKVKYFAISARLMVLRCIYALIITFCEVHNSMT